MHYRFTCESYKLSFRRMRSNYPKISFYDGMRSYKIRITNDLGGSAPEEIRILSRRGKSGISEQSKDRIVRVCCVYECVCSRRADMSRRRKSKMQKDSGVYYHSSCSPVQFARKERYLDSLWLTPRAIRPVRSRFDDWCSRKRRDDLYRASSRFLARATVRWPRTVTRGSS